MAVPADSGPPVAFARLAHAGLILPAPIRPSGRYRPYTRSGALLYAAGQIARSGSTVLHSGLVGVEIDLEGAIASARQCALNVLATVADAVDDELDRLRLVNLLGFVRADARFTAHTAVVDGASEIFEIALGKNGAAARTAVGVASLPLAASVEIATVFEVL